MATPAHRKNPVTRRFGVRTTVGISTSAVAIVAIVVGVAVFASQHSSAHATTSAAAGGSGGGSGGGTTTTTPVPPLSVVSISPAASAANVASNEPITITFSRPLAHDVTQPTLTPPVAGTWTESGATLTFHPTGGYMPWGTEQVTVPATTAAAPVHKKVTTLAAAYQVSFAVAQGSELRVEQMLAELDYMPLVFVATAAVPATPTTTATTAVPTTVAPTTTPTTTGLGTPGVATTTAPTTTVAPTTTTAAPTATPASTLAAEATTADAVAVLPEVGTFAWRFASTPSSLQALWTQGTANTIDMGAIMAFENAHGMKMDGIAGPQVFAALVQAIATRQITTAPYDYLVANKTEPESLTVYQNGADIYSSPANTGVASAPTPDGTWPVYDRSALTTMTGTNPDGSTYSDPDIPWVAYFHGGDAVHGFDRGSYGVPQSVGCVELPPANAAIVYNDDPYGTLVTVED